VQLLNIHRCFVVCQLHNVASNRAAVLNSKKKEKKDGGCHSL
jgi:hypothetical protein